MKDVKVIALVGMPGAGKSSCIDYLESKGVPSVYFGGITVDEVKRRGLAVNQVNEKAVREELRATEGLGVMANRIIKKIEDLTADGHKLVAADGLYSWTEYKIFEEVFGENVIFIAIAAPRKVRHARLENRPVRALTPQEANDRDYAEIENSEKGGPIANADYTILNDSTPEKMIETFQNILESEGFSPTT